MAHVSDFLTPADLQKISNLQVVARQVVEGFCSGMHRSPHKGFSVEFKQHRQYVPGDEIRHIDWRVFGRSDRFYIREYEEETNLRATLLARPQRLDELRAQRADEISTTPRGWRRASPI